MDGGPETHWFNGPREYQFTSLEEASIEFGTALVASLETGEPIDPKLLDVLSTEAAKKAEHNRKMKLAEQMSVGEAEALNELKRELACYFGVN